MTTHQKQLYVMLMKWIHYIWFQNVDIDLSKRWIDIVGNWVEKNGSIWTISHIKMIRNVFTRFICGQPCKRVDMILGIDKDGFPKVLKPYKELINSQVGRRYILTLLSISRCLPGTKKPDYSTITKPSAATDDILKELVEFIPVFMERYSIKPFGTIRWTQDDLHYSVKSGPLGPSTLTAQADMYKAKSLLPAWKKMAMFVPIILEKLMDAIPERSALKFTSLILGKKEPVNKPGFINVTRIKEKELKDVTRRLSIVDDPEAKARIVAIFDYWSQSILRKLHLRLFELLETFKQDRTFTQDPYIPRRLGHKYHSLDLSAATDRFPLKLQKELIAKLVSGPYADGWEEVLVGTPFVTPEGDSVVYNAGQPMGAYSSWATFAVTHHMVIDYAAFKEGLDPQSEYYILLGDDVVINHDGVADRYRNIMSSLGVDISPMKTHVSYTTYEFAKRWFHYGKEITGIQLAGFMNILESGLNIRSKKWVDEQMKKCTAKSGRARNSYFKRLWKSLPTSVGREIPVPYHLITAMLCQLRDRGIPYRMGLNIPDQVSLLYKCLGYKSKHISNLRRKATNFNALMKYFRSHDPLDIINVVRTYYDIGNNKNMGDFLYPHSHEDQHDLVLRHLYLAMDSSVQSKLNRWLNYSDQLVRSNWKAIEGLLDQSDMWKSPVWMFHQLPLCIAIEGVIKGTTRLLSGNDLEDDLKRCISFTSIPDPDRVTNTRASTRLLGSQAELANRFMFALHESAQGRPTMLQNYGNRALVATSAHRKMNLHRNRRPYYGLIPE